MKKLLVASTALVAVAAVSSANAADPIKLSLGGYMNQYVGYVDQDSDAQQKFVDVNINSETEVYFRGSTKLDNGLTIGVNIDVDADRNDSFSGDDVFMQISSDSLGKLRIGQTKGAAYALSHTAPSVGAVQVNDGDLHEWINRPTQSTKSMTGSAESYVYSDQTHTASEANDGQKIVYWTPSFAGVTAGFSYGVNANNTGVTAVIDQGSTAADTAADAGIAYNGEFGGVKVGADLTYQQDFAGGTTGTAVEDRNSIRGGLSVSVAGFTVGGSYRDTDNERNIKDIDSSGWDAGVSYATGPYAVSFTYSSFEEDTSATAVTEDSVDGWAVGGSYDLGAGVKLVGSVFGAEYTDASSSAANSTADNEGFGVVAGLEVNF